ncbi:hypothetical protein GCM10027612_66700 [Microbispora bryophytorum subsp. camponoti]
MRGTTSVAATTFKGRVVHRLIRGGAGLYAAHTNADVADPGVSDALARAVGLRGICGRSSRPPATRAAGSAASASCPPRCRCGSSPRWPPRAYPARRGRCGSRATPAGR